jgi:hypothetical protein
MGDKKIRVEAYNMNEGNFQIKHIDFIFIIVDMKIRA